MPTRDAILTRFICSYSSVPVGPDCTPGNTFYSQERPQHLSYTMEILHQLGQLFLEALPTVFIVLIFFVFLRWAFFFPIQKAMAERTARIEGARAEAAAVEAEARQELDAYRDALRKARAEIYAEQESSRQAALDSRAQLLKAMRARAQEDIAAAKKRIASEVQEARAQIERESPALAGNIARIILEKPAPQPGGTSR
jgi:F0F1-type ATP synthase membrane subunit b/b'